MVIRINTNRSTSFTRKLDRRFGGRRRNGFNPTALNVARLALKVAKHEKKYLDQININAQRVDTGGFVATQNLLVQGVADGQRIGNKVFWNHMMLKGEVFTSITVNNVSLRVMVVLDRQINGNAIASGALLVNNAINFVMVSGIDPQFSRRIKVLYDKIIKTDNLTKPVMYYKRFIKLNIPTRYVGNLGTTAAVQSNGILIYIYANTATVGDRPTVTIFNRMRYSDQ